MVMDLGNLVRFLQIPYKEEELIPASSIQTEEDRNELLKECPVDIPLYKDVVSLCQQHNIEPSYIYIAPKQKDPFCYYHFPVFIPISVLDDSFFSIMQVENRIKMNEKHMNEALEEKDYTKIFAWSNDNAKILLLNKLYWEVPLDKRYHLWKDIYQLIDYGHTYMNPDMIQDAIQHQSSKYRKDMIKRLYPYFNEEGDLTIYRGVGQHSIYPEQAMSWTISLSVACYFASRYEKKGKVYQAKIHKDHIIDYLRNRNEEEILVQPEHLVGVKEYPIIQLNEELEVLQEEGYMEEYFLYRNTYMKEEDYHDPDGIHGIPHVKRVLYHCLAMSKQLNLSHSERAILANVATYHDIGREHDGYCIQHGFWSWEKYLENIEENSLNALIEVNFVKPFKEGNKDYELRRLNEEETEITRFIIEYHCIRDDEAKEELKHRSIQDKEKAWKLYEIFKDCDGLDRIRLGKHELDTSYLRTDVAKKRVLLAYYLMKVKGL